MDIAKRSSGGKSAEARQRWSANRASNHQPTGKYRGSYEKSYHTPARAGFVQPE